MFKLGVTFLAASAFGLFIVTSGRPISYFTRTDISQIVSRPSEYDGKLVTVSGTVASSVGLMGFGAYNLRQGDVEITIVSARGVPPLGAEIAVTGLAKQAIAFNSIQHVVIVEAGAKELADRVFHSIRNRF